MTAHFAAILDAVPESSDSRRWPDRLATATATTLGVVAVVAVLTAARLASATGVSWHELRGGERGDQRAAGRDLGSSGTIAVADRPRNGLSWLFVVEGQANAWTVLAALWVAYSELAAAGGGGRRRHPGRDVRLDARLRCSRSPCCRCCSRTVTGCHGAGAGSAERPSPSPCCQPGRLHLQPAGGGLVPRADQPVRGLSVEPQLDAAGGHRGSALSGSRSRACSAWCCASAVVIRRFAAQVGWLFLALIVNIAGRRIAQ